MRRRTFKPNTNSTNLDKERITSKGLDGEVVEIDIEDVRACLRSLKKSGNKPIADLKGKDKDNFNMIVKYVTCFSNSGSYEVLHEVIQEEFSEYKEIKAGTVVGYMLGSLSCSKDPCDMLCVSSAPSTNYTPCQNKVIVATAQQGKYNFSVLNDKKNTDRAIIYVTNTQFLGFTEEEKKELSSLGVAKCQLKTYISGETLHDITPDYIPVGQIKLRSGDVPDEIIEKPTRGNSYNLAFILLIIIIVLVLFFVTWKLWQ
jgi:hypothetical protein